MDVKRSIQRTRDSYHRMKTNATVNSRGRTATEIIILINMQSLSAEMGNPESHTDQVSKWNGLTSKCHNFASARSTQEVNSENMIKHSTTIIIKGYDAENNVNSPESPT